MRGYLRHSDANVLRNRCRFCAMPRETVGMFLCVSMSILSAVHNRRGWKLMSHALAGLLVIALGSYPHTVIFWCQLWFGEVMAFGGTICDLPFDGIGWVSRRSDLKTNQYNIYYLHVVEYLKSYLTRNIPLNDKNNLVKFQNDRTKRFVIWYLNVYYIIYYAKILYYFS